jgi:hypothetical protein
LTKTNEKGNLRQPARRRETRKLIAIEKRSVQLLALLLIGSIWFRSWAVSLGVLLGGAVAILNFHWLWLILGKVIFDKQWLFGVQIFFKFLVLVFVIFVILRYAEVNPIAFVAGSSTLLVGILYEGIRGLAGR